MLDFLKILNIDFCCTIKGKFHVKNEKNEFGSTDRIVLQKYLNNIYLKKLKIPLHTGESGKRTLAN